MGLSGKEVKWWLGFCCVERVNETAQHKRHLLIPEHNSIEKTAINRPVDHRAEPLRRR